MQLGEKFDDAIQNSFISLGWNGSFESLIQRRQKQYSKFYNKEINLGFKSFFTSFKALFFYTTLMVLLYFSLEVKVLSKSILISLIVLFLALVVYSLFNFKKVFKSASLLASFSFLSMILSFLNCFLFFPKVFLDVQEQSNIYLSIVILILYPMFYVGYQTFFKKYQKINSIYLKLIKP
jgi:hypothetical protein